jgi:hypothetical protein
MSIYRTTSLRKFSSIALLLGAGYLCGVVHTAIRSAGAQPGTELSESTADKVREANAALQSAMQSLESENRYVGITIGPTAFLVLSGGGDAQADLESGNGVDPETFAALYAAMSIEGEDGLIDPTIKEALALDAEGRVTYNGEVVKLYNRQTLQEYFASRVQYSETQL